MPRQSKPDATDRNAFIEDQDRQQLRDQIGAFLEAPTASSGILVVCGPRGVGKTRLVDQYLNTRDPRKSRGGRLLRLFFGDPECSRRLSVKREPRGARRLIIPVPVSPFAFRDGQEGSDGKARRRPEEALLRNVVFGLTNAIDPHLSLRRYGKTLRARLGWWRFWFSPTALLAHRTRPFNRVLLPLLAVLVASALGLVAGGLLWQVITHGPLLPPSGGWWPDWIRSAPLLGWIVLPALAVSTLLGWLLARFWDWRTLARFNDLLYDLIHAESSQLDQSVESRSHLLKIEGLTPLRIIGVLAALVGLGGLGGLLPGVSAESPSIETLGIGLATLLGALLLDRRKTNLQSKFSADNVAWTLNLMRRYLYLLHRCGIEPVLVIDELDKLEDPPVKPAPLPAAVEQPAPGGEGSNAAGEAPDASPTSSRIEPTTPVAPAPEQPLDDLLESLAKLKDSLGTEFLWILIGGPDLWHRISRERRAVMPGRLATVFPRLLVVGPASWSDANRFLEQSVDDQFINELVRHAAWIHARGHYALMPSALKYVPIDSEGRFMARVQAMKAWLDGLLQSPSDNSSSGPAVHEELLLDLLNVGTREPIHITQWRRLWLFEGIMALAGDLLFEHNGLVVVDADEMQTRNEGQVLASDDPDRINRRGRVLLIKYLQAQRVLSATKDDTAGLSEPERLKIEVDWPPPPT